MAFSPNDEDSEDEGFRLLLGDIALANLQSSAWDVEDDENQSPSTFESDRIVNITPSGNEELSRNKKHQHTESYIGGGVSPPQHQIAEEEKQVADGVFSNAFQYTTEATCTRPPVRIVDLSSINDRGNALVSTRFILRGEIIYTERAIEATQMPQSCQACSAERMDSTKLEKGVEEQKDGNKKPSVSWSSPLYKVRACQNCFRSLEPASSCSNMNNASGNTSVDDGVTMSDHPSALQLPMAHLWPIAEYEGNVCREYQSDETNIPSYVEDQHRRVQCQECCSLFCSVHCKNAHNTAMGSCCLCNLSIQAVVHALFCHPAENSTKMHESFESYDCEQLSVDTNRLEIQPAVIMATRMFCSEVNRFRTSTEKERGLELSPPFHGICGDPTDINPLELGLQVFHTNEEVDTDDISTGGSSNVFSLEPGYIAICETLALTSYEREVFPLLAFHGLAAVAARNGFCVTTQSPFRSYHSALLRAAGGRGTERHHESVEEIARVLGSTDGTLSRQMDKEVAARCTAEIVALFKLTARINHSCDPCAEVRGGEFVDWHIDLVATRDIEPGEEITISYINVGRTAGRASSRTRRIRELQSRYLFICDCHRCKEGIDIAMA